MRSWQIRVDIKVETGWTLLHPAQHEMLDGIEANRAHAQCCLDRSMDLIKVETLHQPQNLDILAPAGLE